MAVRSKFSEAGEFQPEWKPPVRFFIMSWKYLNPHPRFRQSKLLQSLLLPNQKLFLRQNRPGVSSVHNAPKGKQERTPKRSLQLRDLDLALSLRKHQRLTFLPGHSGDVRDFQLLALRMEMNRYKSAANPLLRPGSAINSPSTAPATIPHEPPPRAGLFGILHSCFFFRVHLISNFKRRSIYASSEIMGMN